MNSSVDQIKDRLSILDVVSGYIKLTKAGKDYKGLSPFTKEKTPSFFVSPDRGVYYCFSTNKGGDMFTFVQEMENVDFKGALHILAEKAGVDIVHEQPGSRDAKERLYIAHEHAAQIYVKELTKNTLAQDYLKKRGLSEHTISSFRIGYAPTPESSSWRFLTTQLEREKFSKDELVEAGLSKRGERGDLYDQFRGRIVFPLFDAAGRVVGFSGRLFPDDPEKTKKAPKYLNSPDTPLYHKSKFLYGYDRARVGARTFNFSMLVEGQMDIVMAHQAGFTNTVAVSGTALTEDHLTLLKRLSTNLLLAYDEDAAGLRACLKTARMALGAGMEVKVAKMPLGKDPADVIKENPQLFKDSIKHAEHVIPFALASFKKSTPDPRAYAKRVRLELLPLLACIDNAIDRAGFVRLIAERLSIREDAVWEDLEKVSTPESSDVSRPGDAARSKRPPSPLCLIIAKIQTLKETGKTTEAETLEQNARAVAGETAFIQLQKSCPPSALYAHQFAVSHVEEDTDTVLRTFELQVLERRIQAVQTRIASATESDTEALLKEHQALLARRMQLSKELAERE